MLHTMLNGLAMALADSVPGVSGGTIAYILGFYERFINALHALFSKSPAQRKEAILYFCKFGIGWLIGMGSSVIVLTSIFDTNIYFLSSVFIGLTVAAIPYILRAESATLSKSYSSSIFVLIGVLMVALLTASRSLAAGAATLNLLALTPLAASLPGNRRCAGYLCHAAPRHLRLHAAAHSRGLYAYYYCHQGGYPA